MDILIRIGLSKIKGRRKTDGPDDRVHLHKFGPKWCFYPKVTIPMNSEYSIQIIVQILCLDMLAMTIDQAMLDGVIVI